MSVLALPRREFLKAGGAMVIGFSMRGTPLAQERAAVAARAAVPGPPDQKLIDTWIAIHADNTATAYIGYAELGQGASTALLQIAAEELDLAMSQISSVRLDTHVTPNQGATVASAAIERGGPQIRAAAAEARQALLALASRRLGVPADQLAVSNGVVSVAGDASRTVKYGDLLGDQPFAIAMTGTAPQKTASQYRIVGARHPRLDLPDKMTGRYTYVQHVRLPGMLHARVVRPLGQGAYADGARIASLDESSIANIPGVRVVRRRDFLAVVSANEWDAVRAARQLKVTWDMPASLAGTAGLFDQMRSAQTPIRSSPKRATSRPRSAAQRTSSGDVPRAVSGAHAVRPELRRGRRHAGWYDGDVLDTRRLRHARQGGEVLGVAATNVRVQYFEGAGTFGRSCYDDAAQAAALVSKEVGAPVRVQFSRADEHGWDNFGPAHLADVKAGVDAGGRIVAYEYDGWQHVWSTVETSEQLALGTPASESPDGTSRNLNKVTLGSMYDIPNLRLNNHRVPGITGYLKASNLRSPLDVSFAFASEQALDELAQMAGIDPLEFRRRNMSDPRWLAVLDAVAKAAQWTPRTAASARTRSTIVTGRGVGLGTHMTSYGAAIADVRVNRSTGAVVATHMYGAIDAGLVVNPAAVENQISGQLVQAASRLLKEEVTFSRTNVTSLDWNSYPILRFAESPAVTAIVLQHVDQKSTGAGEEIMAAASAAIANAFFDATGVRLREYPFTPVRVKTALA